jgi:hypothetical protein
MNQNKNNRVCVYAKKGKMIGEDGGLESWSIAFVGSSTVFGGPNALKNGVKEAILAKEQQLSHVIVCNKFAAEECFEFSDKEKSNFNIYYTKDNGCKFGEVNIHEFSGNSDFVADL